MALPLEGIKILDLSTMLPGPFCSMILADFGAEVIKVEAVKGGDLFRGGVPKIGDTGGAFFQVNRNKKSITLNLKSEEGKEIFYKLAKDADVVLEQYRPGIVKKLGVDYETIKAINPKIVYCSLSGYGQTGPYRLTSGHDLNYISYAGILGLTARKGQTPTIPGVQIADIGGGALYAAIGILIALMGVKQNGVGQYVDTSMLDGAVSWLPVLANDYFVKGVSPKAAENILNGQNACYEVYETADGRYISIGAIEPHLWANFCDAIGKEEFKLWQRDLTKQDEMFACLREMFKSKTQAEWIEKLTGVDCCWAPVKNLEEVFADPQVLARDMVYEMTGDMAAVQQLISILLDNAFKYSDDGGEIRLSVYAQHKNKVIEVYNTCPPDSLGDIDRFFDRFYRADKSRTYDGGTGIGLAIARAIVQALGGSINAETSDGKSIVFRAVI